MKCYNLDPSHYFSFLGFSWDACLRYTKIELELKTNIDQYLLVEKGIRGGISIVSNRTSTANNKYLPNFDINLPNKLIIALDFNSLYGYAMRQPLPTGDFIWLTSDEIKQLQVQDLDDNAETGYILEVDLLYPHHIHDYTSDYPLAPEKKWYPTSGYHLTPHMLPSVWR